MLGVGRSTKSAALRIIQTPGCSWQMNGVGLEFELELRRRRSQSPPPWPSSSGLDLYTSTLRSRLDEKEGLFFCLVFSGTT